MRGMLIPGCFKARSIYLVFKQYRRIYPSGGILDVLSLSKKLPGSGYNLKYSRLLQCVVRTSVTILKDH